MRCRVEGVGCRVEGVGCRVEGAGCQVEGAECGTEGGVLCRTATAKALALLTTKRRIILTGTPPPSRSHAVYPFFSRNQGDFDRASREFRERFDERDTHAGHWHCVCVVWSQVSFVSPVELTQLCSMCCRQRVKKYSVFLH